VTRRAALAALLGLAAGFAAPASLGRQVARPRRLGYLLLPSRIDPPSAERRAFFEGLNALGYVEGRNIQVVYRSAEGAPEFLDEVALDLVKQRVDVICTAGAATTLSALHATKDIPIVMLAVGDPVDIGAARSIARPGRNATGVSFISSELAPKRLELARELLPRARRVALLWDTRNHNAREEVIAVRNASKGLGLTVDDIPVESESVLDPALGRLARRGTDVLYAAFEGGLIAGHRTQIAEFALRNRMALVAGWGGLPEVGGLLSYAPDIPDMFRKAAGYVHRILQGEKPQSMPIQMPTRVELVVNRKTAAALGLTISQSLLLRADRVIE
jgi:putative tryptophan/tyrosine transport system substrate-binding protein